MSAMEPGEKFDVTYGKGKTVQAAALSLRGKRFLARHMESIKDPDVKMSDKLTAMEEAVKLCCPGIAEETLEVLGDTQAMEIIGGVMQSGVVGKEEAKKSE